MKTDDLKNQNSGRWVLLSFLGFFAIFCSVDVYFVYKALSTNTGLVIENSYYKGLDYNKTLNEAKQQQESGVSDKTTFKNGLLRFELFDKNNTPIPEATVKANFKIPTHDGADFEINLISLNNGIYEGTPNLPVKGLWVAHIEAKWDMQKYKTTLTFTKP